MVIQVEYKDTNGNISKYELNLSYLAFVKHLAISGFGLLPEPQKIIRILSMFFLYQMYIRPREFYFKNRFSEPPNIISDPTEKAHFSNLAGKAIADFLSKKINNSLFTINYETIIKLIGGRLKKRNRPDLIAFTKDSIFSIEAKGRSSNSHGNIERYKNQARSVNYFSVNFCMVSISYNLYSRVRCKYYDPYIADVPYDKDLFSDITKEYYKGLYKFIEVFKDIKEVKIQGEKFYEVKLSYENFYEFYLYDFHDFPIFLDFLEYYEPHIILPINIEDFANKGLSNVMEPFKFKEENNNRIYVDNDRVGLKLKRGAW